MATLYSEMCVFRPALPGHAAVAHSWAVPIDADEVAVQVLGCRRRQLGVVNDLWVVLLIRLNAAPSWCAQTTMHIIRIQSAVYRCACSGDATEPCCAPLRWRRCPLSPRPCLAQPKCGSHQVFAVAAVVTATMIIMTKDAKLEKYAIGGYGS